jgi:hypothetical protein
MQNPLDDILPNRSREHAFSESMANLRSRVLLACTGRGTGATRRKIGVGCHAEMTTKNAACTHKKTSPLSPIFPPLLPLPSLFSPLLLLSLPPSPPPSLSFPSHGANTGHISATAHASDPLPVTSDASDDATCDGSLCRAARGIMNSRGRFAACGRILRATHLQSRGGSRGGAPRKTAPNPLIQFPQPSDAF